MATLYGSVYEQKVVPGSVSLIELKSSCVPCWLPPRACWQGGSGSWNALAGGASCQSESFVRRRELAAPTVGSEALKPGKYNKKLVPNPNINAKCIQNSENTHLAFVEIHIRRRLAVNTLGQGNGRTTVAFRLDFLLFRTSELLFVDMQVFIQQGRLAFERG